MNGLDFYGIDQVILPCPKCGKAPIPIEMGGSGKFEAKISCIHCGTHTRTFGEKKVLWMTPEDGESNDDIRRRVCLQAIEAWNAGRFIRTVEDIRLDVWNLGVLGEMIQDYLEKQEQMTPAERVLGWDALKRKWRECGQLVRKEVEDGA